MEKNRVDFKGSWIWKDRTPAHENEFIKFRRDFTFSGGAAYLHITADTRYELYVNGVYLGFGPVRAWPAHYRYDSYDIAPYLSFGKNSVAVLVNHMIHGTFQSIPSSPGLLAQIELEDGVIATDSDWLCAEESAFSWQVPRISVQEAFEEQYDARLYDGWKERNFDCIAAEFKNAVEICGAEDGEHRGLEHRGIPSLTLEPHAVKRVVSAEYVETAPYRFTLNYESAAMPGEITSNRKFVRGALVSEITAPDDCSLKTLYHFEFGAPFNVTVNGSIIESAEEIPLKKGKNLLVIHTPFYCHMHEFPYAFDGPLGLTFSSPCGTPFCFAGPFELGDKDREQLEFDFDDTYVAAKPRYDFMDYGLYQKLISADSLNGFDRRIFSPLEGIDAPKDDVYLTCYTERPLGAAMADTRNIVGQSDFTVIEPDKDGRDIRLLLDFGKEVVGFHQFTVDAPEGAVLDFHNFEFIQPDGLYNFAEGMRNSFRYICRSGLQTYKSFVRRGFQYSYLTIRNLTAPIKFKDIKVLFSSYPQSGRGYFECSDQMLNKIWQVGAHTLRCCSEDTYTDCPTYEQTHWVGDARNEALVDYVVNGDPRLWFRCIEQVGDSLERSVITESQTPSSWQNLLPSWSLLWMRSCAEYYRFTGDRERAQKLFEMVRKNVDGFKQNMTDKGLFAMPRAWNMFDWAAMDTPHNGTITHLNCFLVLALSEAAEMGDMLGRHDAAEDFRSFAADVKKAVNEYLWDDDVKAYVDCLSADGSKSRVFSQQTQTAAYMSSVAEGERKECCRNAMYNPPSGFVKAGSPFFEFFLLEGLQREERVQEFLDVIRRDWGFMVNTGASTFWEMWSWGGKYDGSRLTRSHCHGWSSAPTYFLSTYILGVTPLSPGFKRVKIAPRPGDLHFCRGALPTPYGDVVVKWYVYDDGSGELSIEAPAEVEIETELPKEYKFTVNIVKK